MRKESAMNGFFSAVAMLSGLVAQSSDQPVWRGNYLEALREAQRAGVPLVIVLDRPGVPGERLEQVSLRSSRTAPELLKAYRLCHVDVSTDYGRRVAAAFKADRFPYTAITDREGKWIVFEKTGGFTGDEWTATLAAYRRGERPEAPPAVSSGRPRLCFT
jgi:hypothetical protein